jgi:opacity protein-like surface antigen
VCAGALAFAALLASSAIAQDDSIPRAEPMPAGEQGRETVAPGQTPAEEVPIGQAHRRNPGPGFGAGRSHARLRWERYRIPFEVDQFRSSAGFAGGSRGLNRRTDWVLEKTSMRLEGGTGFGSEEVQVDVYGGLGWGWTEIGLDTRTGSDLSPGGPAVALDFDSEIDFDLSAGIDVWAFVTSSIFVGVGYQFIFSHAEFDHEVFIATPVDGQANLTIHDLSVRVGARINRMVSTWLGAGITAVWGDVDLRAKTGGGIDFELENDAWVKGLVGFALHPGDNVVARFEAQFMPEPSFRVDVGWSF